MNNMYYECTVKYDRVQENGLNKTVSEKYLVDAISFSEAEKRIIEEMTPHANSNLDVTAIRRQQITYLFESKNAQADRWYKAKLAFITIDEKTQKEKRTPATVMVRATDFDDARNAIEEGMRGSMADWEKAVLSETPIMDVFKYEVKSEK